MHASPAAPFVLVYGSVLSLVAGAMAYLISYDEALHRFARRRARREGLRSGLVALAFFLVVTAVLALVV